MSTGNLPMGRGAGLQYDVLRLEDGMTIKELREQIAHLPETAKIAVPLVAERISNHAVRIPILVRMGQPSPTAQELAKMATEEV